MLRLAWGFVLALAATASAQTGSGISGGTSGRAAFDFVREEWGSRDSVRLVAAVLWRGSTRWANSLPSDSAWYRTTMDSLRRAERATGIVGAGIVGAGIVGAGTVTPRGFAWVAYDQDKRRVHLLGSTWPAPGRDSALVLLVDRIDRVGGEPVVEAVVVPAPPGVWPRPDSGSAGYDALQSAWFSALRSHSRVGAFLESMRLRVPGAQ